MTADILASRMRELSLQFLASLPDDMAMITTDPSMAATIAHRIAGRAGTFGFPALSALASLLEMLAASTSPPGADYAEALAALANEVKNAMVYRG